MKLLFYRHGNICESAVANAFRRYDLEVIEENSEITREWMLSHTGENSFSFLFSMDFYPSLARLCILFQIPYLSWVTDCPALSLYSDAVKSPWNRIFLFDRMMYEELHPKNPDCIFYLPLAVDTNQMNLACLAASRSDIARFSSDISFVGSLYKERSPLSCHPLPDFESGYVDALIDAQLQFYGSYLLRDALTPEMTERIKAEIPDFPSAPEFSPETDTAILADYYIGRSATTRERTRLLSFLSHDFSVDLYTASDVSALPDIHPKGTVQPQTEMPLVFRNSKVNLNITSRSIRSGIPSRIWNILGAGGFLLTNAQTELTDFFTPDEELTVYSSAQELMDKAAYYLENEKARTDIAQAGYEKVRAHHSFEIRMGTLLKTVFPDF